MPALTVQQYSNNRASGEGSYAPTIGTGIVDSTTLNTFTGTLSAGKYYARIGSRGGDVSAYEPNAPYYTMGSYFLTGSGVVPVPEPATLAAIAMGLAALARRRRQRA